MFNWFSLKLCHYVLFKHKIIAFMKPFVVANWKANANLKILKELKYDPDVIEVALACPSLYSTIVRDKMEPYIKLCAQDCSRFNTGRYTGETPAVLLKDVGVEYVIIGHCERRINFNEDAEILATKVQNALQYGLKVVYCIGESREDRENGTYLHVLYNQFFTAIGKDKTVDIAYEPVWSIGTGALPSPAEVQDIFKNIRKWADSINLNARILYGGSVSLQTIKDFKDIEGLDGFLLGSLSLSDDLPVFLKSYEQHVQAKSKKSN